MRLGLNALRSRMTLMFVGLLLLVQVATLSLTHYLGARMAAEEFLPVLDHAETAVRAELDRIARPLSLAATAASRASGLRRAASAREWETTSGLLRGQAERQHLDLALFIDAFGRIRAASDPGFRLAPDVAFEVPAVGAKNDVPLPQFVLDAQGRPVLVGMAPIDSGGRAGYVGAGQRLDVALARMKSQAGSVDLTIMARRDGEPWKLAATTVDSPRSHTLEDALARDLGAAGVFAGLSPLDLRKFETRFLGLPARGSDVALALQQSLGNALAPFQALRTVVTVVTVLGMLVFVMGSHLIASSITRPVRELARSARLMRFGDYSEPIRARASGEIAELASSLESMRGEVARREAEVHRMAYYDPLTGLANRVRFGEALREAIEVASGRGDDLSRRRLVVLLLDLDRFKWINDTLGHACGDRVLEAAADRLRTALPAEVVVARLGGDEFAVLATGANRPAHELVDCVTRALEAPIRIEEHTVDVGASIGVAHYPEHGGDADELMRHADAAMYTAKRQGVPSAVFDPAVEVNRVRHLSMLSDLRTALERDELELYYQPKVALAPGASRVAAEALVRWQHPDRGMLPPSDFIPFAEQTGFIRQMTIYLLPRAIAQAAAWLRDGTEIAIAVNVSARDLEERGFAERVGRWLARESLPAGLLCLEVTETALMEDPERALSVLRDLRTIGVQLAIDDYGTGLSSLAYLKTLWVNELKIDQGFVRAMAEGERDATIVRSTIELGHSLGLKVTAEGVENAVQAEMLREFGCDYAQGHLFSTALPTREFEHWVRLHAADRRLVARGAALTRPAALT